MRQILQDYLEISKQPLRKEKNRQYKIWFETNYEDLPNFGDLIVFFTSSDKSYFLMNKLLFPMLDDELFNKQNRAACQFIFTNDLAETYADYRFKKHNIPENDVLTLAQKLIPNSPELLEYRYQLLQNYFAFAFHEIPSGILHEMNGATADEAREGLRALEEYTEISKQLGYLEENQEAITQMKTYYHQWINYLKGTILPSHLANIQKSPKKGL
ncbi:hypothetical protein [Listeria booriae]|uniref:hypothetical protein n=1 Tax=Listeria booriae TaxID=1552123 RepID=UPI00162525EC|nr:hypothetical protein [Listeria booriae]MBC1359500.1 hypothetical protein [Listeria booriae]